MKKIIVILILLLSEISFCIAQDVINPYIVNSSYFTPSNGWPLGNAQYPFGYHLDFPNVNSLRLSQSGYYKGEYEMCIRKLFWDDLYNVSNSASAFSASWQYEAVSYPFTQDCAFTTNGCKDGSTTDRFLKMPDPASAIYDASNNYWDYTIGGTNWLAKLYNVVPVTPFIQGYSSGELAGSQIANSLASSAFSSSGIGSAGDRRVIPHTVIKHTINLHCGATPTNNNIVNSLVFYYDNTRGLMRYYPFVSSNSSVGASQTNYDQIFVPDLVVNTFSINQNPNPPIRYNHYYVEDAQNVPIPPDIIMPNGTLNYFPFDDIASLTPVCSNYTIPVFGDLFFNGVTYQKPFPSDYTVMSNPLRQYNGVYFAGYELNNGQIATMPGIQHKYFIDQNTDLNIINPTGKTIYNPSEATITANNFVFPSNYTFKTIRGVYPTVAEVNEDNITDNGYGCTGCDLRVIPVKTDLTSENTNDATNFPLSTQAATKHLYASRYYLDNVNSTYPKLTVGNCVGLFDCAFDVKEGSTMEFTDYPAHYGREDHSYTPPADRKLNRFKIQTLKGGVLRNYAPVQYLQNGNIIQPNLLHYKATQRIYAGSNVDPDTDVPNTNSDYTVQNGANVILEANDAIYLKDGFSALSGSTFSAVIPSTPLASSGGCPSLSVYLRRAGTEVSSAKEKSTFGVQVFPNPTSQFVKLHNNSKPFLAQKIIVSDAFGRNIYAKTNFNSTTDVIDVSTQPNGLYIAKVLANGKSQQIKFVVNH